MGSAFDRFSGSSPPSAGAAKGTSFAELRRRYIAETQSAAGPEYAVEQEQGEVVAKNPSQDLRARFSGEKLSLERAEDKSGWSFSMSLTHFGRERAFEKAKKSTPSGEDNRVSYARNGTLTEWYLNGPLGIEQGFDVRTRPKGAGPLVLRLEYEGDLTAHAAEDGSQVVFHDKDGRVALGYSDVYALDATGRSLPSKVRAAEGVLEIEVDDRGAKYPVVVDPLLWSFQAKIVPPDQPTFFGMIVSLSGTRVAIAAAPDSYAVYLFTGSGPSWAFQAKINVLDIAGAQTPAEVNRARWPDTDYRHAVRLSARDSLRRGAGLVLQRHRLGTPGTTFCE